MSTLSDLVEALERDGAPERAERSNSVLAKYDEGQSAYDLLWCYSVGHVFVRPETRGVKPFDCDQHGVPRGAPRAAAVLPPPPSSPTSGASVDDLTHSPRAEGARPAVDGGYASVRFAHDAVTVPGDVREVVNAVVAGVPALADTVSSAGGVNRQLLKGAIGPILSEFGLKPGSGRGSFAAWEIDYVSSARAVTVSVQTGRAAANNTALLALLAAAALPEVDWAVIVLPHKYKGANAFDAVANQFLALTRVRGVSLSLQGAFIVGF